MAHPAALRTRGAPWTVKPRALASWWARSPPRPTTPLRRADGRTSAAVDCASAAYNDYDADYDSGVAQTTSQLATSLPLSLLPLPPPSPSPSLSPPTWPPTGPTIQTSPTLAQIAFGAPSSNAKGPHTAGHPRSHLRVSNFFYYVLVVSLIAQTGRLLDFLVGLLTGSLGTVLEPDATLAHFPR